MKNKRFSVRTTSISRIIGIFLFLVVSYNSLAQTASGKENDFIMAISNNPDFNVGDLIDIAGLNTSNTQFLTESQYLTYRQITSRYSTANFHKLYANAKIAWGYFKELQKLSSKELRKLGYNYSQWDVFKQNKSPLYDKYHYYPHSGVQMK